MTMLDFSKQNKVVVLLSIVAVIVISTALLLTTEQKAQENTDSDSAESIPIDDKGSLTQEEYELGLQNNKNLKLIPEKPLNKDISSGHIFGFTQDNALKGGMNAISITNPDEKVSVRFTSKFSGNLTKVHLSFNLQKNITVRIGLQEDNLGTPTGEWIGGSTNYKEVLLSSERDNAKVFDLSNTQLKKDKVYHVVIEPVQQTIEERLFMITYHDNSLYTPFNFKDPDSTWPDDSINTLFFDGDSWIVQDKWPIYVIDYADGFSDGQPYSLMAPWVINESSMVGQTVIPFSNYNVSEFAFVVSHKGNPTDKLYYAVYDNENNILRNGTFATKDQLDKKKSWHNAILNPPLHLKSGDLYRFVLSSPNTKLENSYRIYGHEFMLDQSLGYGSIIHHLTKSKNGDNWAKWYDADTAFKLITE